jgi:hypothetical protein
MGLLARLLLYLLVAAGAVRLVVYLTYAAAILPTPLEAHNLEAKMVLLAWRAQHGLSLYPAWWDGPYVANFFGPVDFLVVGLLGRLSGADVPGLFLIGRAVSFVSGLLTSLVLAVSIGRRYGRGAGLAGGVISLGTGPMYGFTVMVRPDALAELLGLAGFLLCGARSRAGRLAGVVLLVLAILTKQTAVIFLLAAALGLALEGERRRALGVLGVSIAGVIVVIVAVNARLEPHFAWSLVGEAAIPWDGRAWSTLQSKVALASPDLLYLSAVGLGLWLARRPREVRPAALVLVLLVSAVGLSGKVGADLNYYLSLRIAEAMAVGTLWHAVHAPAPPPPGRAWLRSAALTATSALAIVVLGPCLLIASGQVGYAWRRAEYFRGPDGRAVLLAFRSAFAKAQDPRVHLLTDSGLIDVYQGERAAFGDPWLFRKLVETGRIRPGQIATRIDTQYYDLIITTTELNAPGYGVRDFRLPMILVDRARVRYVLTGVRPGLFFYGRRGGGWRLSRSPGPTGNQRRGGAVPSPNERPARLARGNPE